MIKILLTFLITFPLWAKVNLELKIPVSSVKQGEIVEARLQLKAGQNFSLGNLKGKNLSKTLYFLEASPFIGKEGQGFFESDVKVIFLKVPDAASILENINGEEIEINWDNVEVVPTETQKSFLLGDFQVPERKKILPWILGITLFLLLAVVGRIVFVRNRRRKEQKNERKKLELEILSATKYDDIVTLWKKKRFFLQKIPELEDFFHELESTLFKYQFKSHQSASEQAEVVEAYKKCCREFERRASGV